MARSISANVALAAKALRKVMNGSIVLRDDREYAETRKIWNAAVTHEPELFAICNTIEDVQCVINVCREAKIPLSVRGGGHDWAGRALRADGVVIDLSRMRSVSVDPFEQIATIAGGARSKDVIDEAARYGLVPITGNNSDVGYAGFTLGGGYGPLSSRYGLGLDNLLEAELVLADGSRLIANPNTNADLYSGLRGGGGNFGVVTSMRVRLHQFPGLVAGVVVFPWDQAESVLRKYALAAGSHPDELGMSFFIVPGPGGSPVLIFTPVWTGDLAEGQRLISAIERLGTPIKSQVGAIGYGDFIGILDAQARQGLHSTARTRWLSGLTEDVISALVTSGSNRTSPLSVIVGYHANGVPTRVPIVDTAFGLRDRHFLVEIIAMWDQPSEEHLATHQRWADELFELLSSAALPGGYPNLLGPEHHEQIAHSFGPNASRLQSVKQKYDAENVFQSTISLPPTF